MTKPRTRRYLRTRQAILEAAVDIISEEGPDGLSMRALADRIDYSAAGLYEYFGGKDEIIAAVCQEGHNRLALEMNHVDKTLPAQDYLFEIGMAYIRFAMANQEHFLLMFSGPEIGKPPEFSEEQENGQHSSFDILLQAVQRGIENGVFQVRMGFGLMEMAYAAWTLVHGIAMLRITALRDYPADLNAADRQVLRNFERGLRGGQ